MYSTLMHYLSSHKVLSSKTIAIGIQTIQSSITGGVYIFFHIFTKICYGNAQNNPHQKYKQKTEADYKMWQFYCIF